MSAVSLKDIYDVVNRLEGKMDDRLVKIENRVGIIENFQSRIIGIWLGITAVISILGSWVGQKLFNL